MQRKHFNILLASLLVAGSLGIPAHAQEKPIIKIVVASRRGAPRTVWPDCWRTSCGMPWASR